MYALVGRLPTFELDDYDNYLPSSSNLESTFEAKVSLKKKAKRSERKQSKSEVKDNYDSDLEAIEALLARRYPKGKGKYKEKIPLICLSCKEVWHIATRWPNREEKDEKKDNKYKGNKDFKHYKYYKDKGRKSYFIAKDLDSNEDDEMVYITVKDQSDDKGDKMTLISHVRKNDTWIIDSGCSHHMIGDKTKFEYMEHYDCGSVWFGNNEPCCIKGKGCISLTNELIYDNAYWVEWLKHNLLSVAQLNNIGFKVAFMNVKAKLLDGKGNLVGFGKKMKGNLFYLDLSESSCFIAQVKES